MFSDSIHEIMQQLYEEIKHYNEEPFNYTRQFRDELIPILTGLGVILDRLDHPRIELPGGDSVGGPLPRIHIQHIVENSLDRIFSG